MRPTRHAGIRIVLLAMAALVIMPPPAWGQHRSAGPRIVAAPAPELGLGGPSTLPRPLTQRAAEGPEFGEVFVRAGTGSALGALTGGLVVLGLSAVALEPEDGLSPLVILGTVAISSTVGATLLGRTAPGLSDGSRRTALTAGAALSFLPAAYLSETLMVGGLPWPLALGVLGAVQGGVAALVSTQ